MKKIRPYLWRGGALVLAAALVVLLVLSGMGLSTQEPEPLPQPPVQTIRTEGQGGASQQEKPDAPEQPEDPEDDQALCVHGHPNVLTRDVGTSSLAQGCTGQLTSIEVERFTGNLPPIRAFDPPV